MLVVAHQGVLRIIYAYLMGIPREQMLVWDFTKPLGGHTPEAVRAALKTLVEVAEGRRTWAVLGEMRELGDHSLEEHDAVGRLAVRLDIGRLVSVGEGARALHLGASQEGSWGQESAYVADADAAMVRFGVEPEPWEADEDATATINYTSGTTARPKAGDAVSIRLWNKGTPWEIKSRATSGRIAESFGG